MKYTQSISLFKFIILSAIFGLLVFPTGISSLSTTFGNTFGPKKAHAAGALQVWWPSENAKLSGTQPFKAMVEGMDVTKYDMFWQVDGGQLNKMETNWNDYPHKEVTVDLSGWKWRADNYYTLKFTAKNFDGSVITERTVMVYVNQTTPTQQAPVTTTTVTAPTQPSTTATTTTAVVSSPTTTVVSPTPVTSPAPTTTVVQPTPTPVPTTTVVQTAPAAAPTTYATEVWWPANNANLNDVQPFKAVLKDVSLSKYTMYWQVDGGQLNKMADSYQDYPHKEAIVDVSGWKWKGTGPYTLTFVAKDTKGKTLATKNIVITVGAQTAAAPIVTSPTAVTPTTPVSLVPTIDPVPTTPTSTTNPLAGKPFYVIPNNNAKRQADLWRTSRPNDALQMDKIANAPDAKWIGNWNADVYADVKKYVDEATAAGAMPVLIAYNIPSRDCGSYSAGGAANAESYKTWIRNFANGIGTRTAAVVLEPDALAGITCLDQAGQDSRKALLKDAIEVFKSKGNIAVYVDAGHSNWIGVEDMANRLKSISIEKADGFALNVSNYNWTADQITYGTKLSGLIGGKHFVVDTSRNGQGPLGNEWCNPSGRGLGKKATTNTGNSLVDAYMWLKNAGESDGTCNGGPSAGVWWPEYALGLAEKSVF